GVAVAFTATGNYDDSTTSDLTSSVTWASSVEGVATISATGVASPLTLGETILTAKDGDFTGSSKLTVTAAIIDTLVLGPTGLVIPNGTTQQLTALATLSNQTLVDVAGTGALAWSSDPEAVATVDANGRVTGHMTGTTTITATDGVQSWTLSIAVGAPIPISIMIEAGDARVGEGRMLQLAAIGAMSDGTMADLSSQVTWASDDDETATIDAVGVVTGVLAGVVDITATLGSVMGVVTIDVFVPIPLTLVMSNPSVRVIAVGELAMVSARPPVRAVVLESTMPSAGGDGIGDLATISASPPVRAVVLESTMPSTGGGTGAGTGDLATVVARPPVRAIVIESEAASGKLNTTINRVPVKVDFAD
ncbi:MAG: hypothetical protein ACI9MR_005064, partial [Myxococcota bacterium]